jgi:hypothetical protein
MLAFLMEIKMMQNTIAFLKIKLGFDHMFAVDRKGRSGCLILLWKSDIKVEVQNYNRRHINAMIEHSNDEPPWKFTGFYRSC